MRQRDLFDYFLKGGIFFKNTEVSDNPLIFSLTLMGTVN